MGICPARHQGGGLRQEGLAEGQEGAAKARVGGPLLTARPAGLCHLGGKPVVVPCLLLPAPCHGHLHIQKFKLIQNVLMNQVGSAGYACCLPIGMATQ